MKALEKWISAVSLRQVNIWWHWREWRPGQQQFDKSSDPVIYWHVDLHQDDPPSCRKTAKHISKHIFSGYDVSLTVAIRKALKLARKWEKQA